MARLLVCSVFDVKVGAYAAPFFVRTRGEAVRSFMDACEDDKLPFRRHPEDYDLYCLGDFDEVSGLLTALAPCERLIRAVEIVSAG